MKHVESFLDNWIVRALVVVFWVWFLGAIFKVF